MKKGIQVIFMLAVIVVSSFVFRFAKYQYDIKHIEVNLVDFSQVKDGIYQGEFDLFLVKTKVTAKMEAGVLRELTLDDHVHGRGESAESIIDSILQKQSMEVDMVSGATASSKAILKAVEDAFE